MRRAGAELVKVGVAPAERYLDDLVDLVEEQVGGQLKPAPKRRPGPSKVDPDTLGNDIWATRPAPRRRRRRFEEAGKGRPGGEQTLEHALDLSLGQAGHRRHQLFHINRSGIRRLMRICPVGHGDTLPTTRPRAREPESVPVSSFLLPLPHSHRKPSVSGHSARGLVAETRDVLAHVGPAAWQRDLVRRLRRGRRR
jgi:hypothetical protein